VSGNYHELAQFVSDVASLPRIVTFGDISLSGGTGNRLNMTATARTYRYLDSAPADAPASKPRRGGK
jgi:type IV pilus assembly protein PilO